MSSDPRTASLEFVWLRTSKCWAIAWRVPGEKFASAAEAGYVRCSEPLDLAARARLLDAIRAEMESWLPLFGATDR